ncbi:MAG: riboflavin biosynthesis protein RibD [Actinobacteria bacterium 13_1_20CM_3_68_9]|nr:MAG: riboflavin biosynthesis protein RibD [Actinobacteria bacterium 13_1_20CM_3_68_9]
MPVAVTLQDRVHLRRALELAEGGRGRVSPNPLVGAVLVRDGQVIGEGYHAELGGPHAEVAALDDCRARGHEASGATLYVTLEPCAHQGRQPPCTDAILAAEVARVVIASEDPSEKASGRGPGIMRDEGVEVELANGEEAAAARLLNQAFRKHSRTSRPLVLMKSALSLDGRVATAGGDSRWISSEASRGLAHRWRAECDAVCVGIGTALADDPLLTARPAGPSAQRGPRQPTRVVFDSKARLPLDSRLVASVADAPLVVIASPAAPAPPKEALQRAGAEVVVCDGNPAARVAAALGELGRRQITSVLLEGGPTLSGSFLDAGEVDELRLFIAPIVLGGAAARPLVAGRGAAAIAEATRALAMEWERSDRDLLVRARLREW